MSSLAMKLPLLCGLTFALAGSAASRTSAADVWSAHVIAEVSREEGTIHAFAVGDFSGDGHPDLAALLHRPGGTALLRVFIHPGPEDAATQWPSVDVSTLAAPRGAPPGDLVVVSFDDGPISQIVTSHASRETPLRRHRPPSDPTASLQPEAWKTSTLPFDAAPLVSSADSPPAPLRLTAAALDNRPGHELIFASAPSAAGPGQIGWLEKPAAADAPWRFHPLAPYGTSRPIIAADLTADGAADLLWIHSGPDDAAVRSPGIHWLTNPGPDQAHEADRWLHTQIGPEQTNLTQLAVGDLGDDGLLDVAAATDANRIPLYIQHSPRPPGWKPYPIPAPSKAPLGTALALFDLNNDGQTDLIHATAGAPKRAASEGEASETPSEETEPSEIPQPADLLLPGPAAITWYVQIRIGEIPAWVAQPLAQSNAGRYVQLHPMDMDENGVPDLLTLLQEECVSQLVWLTR